ncbi:MAG: hypothetical protein ABGY71_05920 [bacterium]|nr:hypothetical protein [Planctomycetota bacterium]HIL51501.1 hypothetical protein [Planctomycetota bacterium]
MLRRLLTPTACWLLAAAALPGAQVAVPETLPIEVRAHASRLTREGSFQLALSFFPRKVIGADYDLVVALDAWADEYSLHRKTFSRGTSRWKAGESVEISLDLNVPADSRLGFGDELVVLVAFVDPDTGALIAPEYPMALVEDFSEVEFLALPGFQGDAGAAQLSALFAEARSKQAGGAAPQAWRQLEEGLRHAGDDDTKERFRDELLRVGKYHAAAMSELEERVVKNRISAEKVRYWRIVAGRMVDRGRLHGALRLLERTGGALSEQADSAVIGALDDAEREQQRAEDLRQRLIQRLSSEQGSRARELEAKRGLGQKLFDQAEDLAQAGEMEVALELMRRLRRSDDEQVEQRAWKRLAELEDEWVAFTPADELEELEAALEHPSFARTQVVKSHCFLFIGPEDLVQGIPDASKLRFDLAYVFLTDLFGRIPNPDGDRVTVYFKELLDFGGGLGGGKTIDIGRAEAHPKRPVRVDTGLYYHELTHCIDDTSPVFRGFTEGLANMGAAYAFEALDQDSDALHSFDANLEEFKKYFLERDLAYWRIQNYGPSAGFFLHFVEEYASISKARHDWSPLRRFFREYRDAPVRDGREPYIVRALSYYLVRAFGPRAFDDLVRFGFPLEERDRRSISLELSAFDFEDYARFEGAHGEFPTSPLPRDRGGRRVARAQGSDDEEAREARAAQGIISEWKTIGPFFTDHGNAAAVPFEPEWSIDFEVKVTALNSTHDSDTRLIWRDPVGAWTADAHLAPVTIDSTGWLHFDYQPYGQRNAAIYAVTSVTLHKASDVVLHARADDDFILFVDSLALGTYRDRGENGSSYNAAWRGPFKNLPDAQRFSLHLAAGRHRILVKIKNHHGPAGLVLALARPDGSVLDFTADALAVTERPAPRKVKWKRLVRLDARSFKTKSKAAVGSFKRTNKAFRGTHTDGRVAWRRFTVRPGFPKDSPSNLLWLNEKLTRDQLDLRLELDLVRGSRAPKLLLTIQGEGESDGLSGWSLIVLPSGSEHVSVRLERYDRLVYQSQALQLEAVEGPRKLVFQALDDEVSVSLDSVQFLDRVPILPIAGKFRVGLATWGESPLIFEFTVSGTGR